MSGSRDNKFQTSAFVAFGGKVRITALPVTVKGFNPVLTILFF